MSHARTGVRLVVIAIALLLAVPTLAPIAPARAQEQPHGIKVSGQGIVTAKPDIAYLTLGASVRRDSAGAAFDRAESLIAALTETLRGAGVDERDIQTRQFSLGPEFGRSTDNNPPPVVGWRATHTVTVKLRDFGRIGTTIDAAVRALGDEAAIQGISFAIENTDALAGRARALAIDNARAKAEEMAARAGVRLGAVLSIDEISAPAPAPERAVAAPAAAPSFAAQISPGELSVSVTVEVVWAIA